MTLGWDTEKIVCYRVYAQGAPISPPQIFEFVILLLAMSIAVDMFSGLQSFYEYMYHICFRHIAEICTRKRSLVLHI